MQNHCVHRTPRNRPTRPGGQRRSCAAGPDVAPSDDVGPMHFLIPEDVFCEVHHEVDDLQTVLRLCRDPTTWHLRSTAFAPRGPASTLGSSCRILPTWRRDRSAGSWSRTHEGKPAGGSAPNPWRSVLLDLRIHDKANASLPGRLSSRSRQHAAATCTLDRRWLGRGPTLRGRRAWVGHLRSVRWRT